MSVEEQLIHEFKAQFKHFIGGGDRATYEEIKNWFKIGSLKTLYNEKASGKLKAIGSGVEVRFLIDDIAEWARERGSFRYYRYYSSQHN